MDNLQARKEKLDALNSRLRKKKFMAILLAVFSLGVNAFAWFVFTTRATVKVDGKVASWDVSLRDENDQMVNSVEINVDMEPGMLEVSKRYEVDNHGEVAVDMTYTVDSLTIMGRDVDLTGITDVETYLKTYYPFTIDLSMDKTVIPIDDTGKFFVKVNWDFETANKYFALNSIYDYTDGFLYYTKTGSAYNLFEATAENYAANRDTLFLEKDDADTYFGMKCGEYQNSTNESCLKLNITVLIEQHKTT